MAIILIRGRTAQNNLNTNLKLFCALSMIGHTILYISM